jgi:hypothetical protein
VDGGAFVPAGGAIRAAISRSACQLAPRLALHACTLVTYSMAQTSLQWGLRSALYPLFGLRPYDYGIMAARYPMEFHDVITYTLMVSILYLFDRHVRAAQLEGKLAQARLENPGCSFSRIFSSTR